MKSTKNGSPNRTKTILSLDGGGVRGTITVAFLIELENLLRKRDDNQSAKLSDYFDLIGGTSTGAIIATALSLGLSTSDIKNLYFKLASLVFRRSFFRLIGFQAVFDEKNLRKEILKICGNRTLDTSDLGTALAIVMKRMDTGSPWIITNNPRTPYWDDPLDNSYVGNRQYRLADLVRASTAAPHYFAPESISVAENEPPGLFVDGAVTPHNNPSLALFHQVTIPTLGFDWQVGQDEMLIISMGTGSFREKLNSVKARRMTAAGLAIKALSGMISDAGTQALMQMQLMGATDTAWRINSEIGNLGSVCITGEPLFTFQRYDARLEKEWLNSELGISLSNKELSIVRKMEDPAGMPLAFEIGRAAANKFMQIDHIKLLRVRA